MLNCKNTVLFCLALTAFPAIAQPSPVVDVGTIAGRITDQSGAMVSSTRIQLSNLATGEARQTYPYIAGLFRFTALKPGLYELRFHAQGFSDAVIAKVEVKAGEVARADIGLQLSDLNSEITVAADESKKSHTSSLLGDVPVVVAATLREQTLEEAPANITVITAAEIRAYGFRTLGEALSSARGFYFTNDRIYRYGGVRGLNVPGDYNSRFLVMINGHAMTENIYNSNGFFGQDFGLDMDLVERIEIVRGPSTTLYGSNGILANINIVTKRAADQARLRVSTENGSFGEKKVHFSTAHKIGHDASLLISGSLFNGGGRDLYFPAYNAPETNNGIARNAAAERGYHAFFDFSWKEWRFTSTLSSREVQPPIGWGDSVFGTQGDRVRDGRNFAEAAYSHNFASGSTLRWKMSYDNYRYFDQFYFDKADGDDRPAIDNLHTVNKGDWVNSQLSYTFAVPKVGELTVGGSGQFELRAQQFYENYTDNRRLIDINRPDRTAGGFAQQEIKINKQLTAYVGVRYDHSRNYSNYLSPQTAVVWTPTARTILKGVYGRPFRNPSTFEQYYGDGYDYKPSGGLKQETAQVFEGSVERKLTPKWSVLANYYQYQINNLIKSITVDSIQQYVNTANSDRSQGFEFEVAGRPRPWMQFVASYGYGVAKDTGLNQWLDNSPRHLGKVRATLPVFHDKIRFSASTNYMGARQTSTGDRVREVVLTDFTVNTSKIHRNFDVIAGVRNALGWRYDDPTSLLQPKIPQDRQMFFLKLVYHSDAN